jgi:ribosomal protein S18 acetylase RimI-like enzyme
MDSTIIRKCIRKDEDSIIDICYDTGFMGENLKNKNIFNDKKLFGYLFCFYYFKYEINNCFVAEDALNNKLIGYIIGTLDTKKQEKLFAIKMYWRICLRVLTYTWWKHPETIKSIIYYAKNIEKNNNSNNIMTKYPAHFHINIVSQNQKSGIGSSLLKEFEKHTLENNVYAIHLETTNMNIKAVSFYLKNGYEILSKQNSNLWKGIDNCKIIVFGKRI